MTGTGARRCRWSQTTGCRAYMDFFIDKEMAEAFATKILVDKQNLLKGELQAFELLTSVKAKAKEYSEKYPSIFV